MFDSGEYSFAISNLMHGGVGFFKIVRIDQKLEPTVMFDSQSVENLMCLEYLGRFNNDNGYVILASGYAEMKRMQDEERQFQDKTLLFQIDHDGDCKIMNEWQISTSTSNSMAVSLDFVYFGQNNLVSRLNLTSGELLYFTSKDEEALKALRRLW